MSSVSTIQDIAKDRAATTTAPGPSTTVVHPELGDLDLAHASRERCKSLGLVPLDFLRWNPDLVHAAATGAMPRHLRAFKRFVDIAGAGVLALLVLPFLPFIIIAIRRDSAGPVLYSQDRLGQGGRIIRIYKFRSMYTDAEAAGAQFATQNDTRVTPVGRFMRRTRIDELPQLWNVLRGDMSFVGPRPERPEHMATIEKAIPEFSLRTAVKPGLTGWEQTSSRTGKNGSELRTKLERDLYYIQFASIWMDIQVLSRAVRNVRASEKKINESDVLATDLHQPYGRTDEEGKAA